MELITLANRKLEISPYALTINEFKAIWDKDSSSTKDRAVKELSFVYFMADFKSVYRGYEPVDKVAKICGDLGLSEDVLDLVIQAAINKYLDIQQTPMMRLLSDMESSFDKLGFMFRTYNPTIDTNAVKFKAIIQSMKGFDGIVKSVTSLKEAAEAEMSDATRAKGGHTVGSRELPKGRRTRQ